MFENSYRIRVSARAIVIDQDKILLNHFNNGAYYNTPGGGIEEKENARMAVVREVREETGLEVEVGDLVFTLEYEPHNSGYIYGNGHHISFFFRCKLLGSNQLLTPEIPDFDPSNPEITSQPVWVPLVQLPEINLLPSVNKNLMQYFKTGVFEPLFYEDRGVNPK